MTRKSRPRRACRMCKYYKYLGNNTERLDHGGYGTRQWRRSNDDYRDQIADL